MIARWRKLAPLWQDRHLPLQTTTCRTPTSLALLPHREVQRPSTLLHYTKVDLCLGPVKTTVLSHRIWSKTLPYAVHPRTSLFPGAPCVRSVQGLHRRQALPAQQRYTSRLAPWSKPSLPSSLDYRPCAGACTIRQALIMLSDWGAPRCPCPPDTASPCAIGPSSAYHRSSIGTLTRAPLCTTIMSDACGHPCDSDIITFTLLLDSGVLCSRIVREAHFLIEDH
jgi:hypothetical protein